MVCTVSEGRKFGLGGTRSSSRASAAEPRNSLPFWSKRSRLGRSGGSMNTGWLGLARMLAGSGIVAACGSGGGRSAADTPVPACTNQFAPCGGDIVGRWQIVSACSPEPAQSLAPDCPAGTITITASSISGWYEFVSDGTAVYDGSASRSVVMRQPNDCLPVATCDEYEDVLWEQFADVDAPATITVTCAQQNNDCRCDLSSDFPPMTRTGTYQVQGAELTIALTDGEPTVMPYCVTGDTLVIRYNNDFDQLTLTRG